MTMQKLRALGLTLLVLVASTGCSTNDEMGSPKRAGVHEIYRGKRWENTSCSWQNFENCCTKPDIFSYTCVGFEKPTVASVRVFGKDVAVLLVHFGTLILNISHDLGDTWTTTRIEVNDFIKGGENFTGAVDVLLKDGKAWLYISRLEVHAKGAKYAWTYLYPLDLTTGKLDPAGEKMVGSASHLNDEAPLGIENGKLVHLHVAVLSNPDKVFFTETQLAPEQWGQHKTWTKQEVECTHPGCRNFSALTLLGSDDGDHFKALMQPRDFVEEQCLVTYSRSALSMSYRCVPMYAWPAPRGDEFITATFAGERAAELQGYNMDGHAWAVYVPEGAALAADPVILKPVYLGPGKVARTMGWNFRSRFAGLFLVESAKDEGARASLKTQLVEVQRSGVARIVNLPRSPCDDAATCGDREADKQDRYGQTVWIEPLGNGEYLQIYAVDEDPKLSVHQTVFLAARSKATYSPVATAPAPPPPSDMLPGHPRIQPVPAAEMRLLLASNCGKTLPWTSEEVAMVFNSTPADKARSAEVYKQIMAIPVDKGCAFDLPAPGNCPPPCGPGGTCQEILNSGGNRACTYAVGTGSCNTCTADNRAVACIQQYGSLAISSVLDCGSVGQTCGCTKAADGTCTTTPQCVPPPCSGTTPFCDGNIASSCQALTYCDRMGSTCLITKPKANTNAGCQAKFALDDDSSCDGAASFRPPHCEGRYLFKCDKASQRMRYMDCKALGFSQCGKPGPYDQPACLQ